MVVFSTSVITCTLPENGATRGNECQKFVFSKIIVVCTVVGYFIITCIL